MDDVTLFSHSFCAESPLVRDWLCDNGIEFTERPIDENEDAAEALRATGAFVTPMVLVGDRRVIGYSPRRLRELLTSTS